MKLNKNWDGIGIWLCAGTAHLLVLVGALTVVGGGLFYIPFVNGHYSGGWTSIVICLCFLVWVACLYVPFKIYHKLRRAVDGPNQLEIDLDSIGKRIRETVRARKTDRDDRVRAPGNVASPQMAPKLAPLRKIAQGKKSADGSMARQGLERGTSMTTSAPTPTGNRPLSCYEVLRVARLDAKRAYGDLAPFRMSIVLETEGWRVDFEPPDHLNGGGPHYLIDAITGKILHKKYEQ